MAKDAMREDRNGRKAPTTLKAAQIIHQRILADIEGERLGHFLVPFARMDTLNLDFEFTEASPSWFKKLQFRSIARQHQMP
jgi:hypothetical protein